MFALVSLAAILGPEQSLVRLRAHYVRTEAVCLTRFCSCPRLYKYARRKQHTEMRHIAVSRPDLWQLVPRLLSVSCVCVCVCVCVWGGGWGARCSFSPLPLCLPTPALHCVAPVFRLIKRIRNPGLVKASLRIKQQHHLNILSVTDVSETYLRVCIPFSKFRLLKINSLGSTFIT